MPTTEWQNVREIFFEALRVDAGERSRYLDDACGDNTELRAEVESLLSSVDESKSFLEQPAAANATTIGPDSQLGIGQKISHYKIVSHLASGGMGEVYLAEDQNLRRKVALKVLPAQAFPDSDLLRRFKSEANAVSALNHPNILTIFDFASENGVHLLVSEYVEGETLRERIGRARLTVREAMSREDFDKTFDRLKEKQIPYGESFHTVGTNTGPGNETGARGPAPTIYMFDPNHHLIEIRTYD